MKKTALILFVLAVTVPAMGAVNITIENDANKVTIGYDCDAVEEVRAFALTIAVSDGAFVVDSPESAVDANVADYYIYPGSISFTVEDGNTVIDVPNYGTPIAEQDANGGVLEMASLYSENDPDPNRWYAPASANDLASFYVDYSGGCVTVTLSENSKRGGIVLKDPNETPTVNLPAPLEVCGVCQYPECWDYLTQCYGDTNNNGTVKGDDFYALKNSWYKSYPDAAYDPCADFNRNGSVKGDDFFVLKTYWYQTVPTDCPTGDLNGIYCP